jgi:hypothetical protein
MEEWGGEELGELGWRGDIVYLAAHKGRGWGHDGEGE